MTNSGVDEATKRIQAHFKHWHSIANLSDAGLAQQIRTDGIDILIDLSSHTANNRLLCFAQRPAPVQISWIGYGGTTGLSSMDYYLADRFFLPPGRFDDQFTEKIVQLPASAPFMPFIDSPPVNDLPASGNGNLTFGSFNLPRKLSPSVVALWSELLRALPNSKMVLGAMPKAGSNELLIEWFAREGIISERLIFYPKCQVREFLALHHSVDICLDTFPYSAGTTGCHALWMGVPTLTLAGDVPLSWMGASIQIHAGLEKFVAHSKAEFVKKGVYWSERIAQLAEIRRGLRERFAQSAMGQPELIATALDYALRTIWQRWCAGLPAESFEVRLEHQLKALQS